MRVWTISFRLKSFSFNNFQSEAGSLMSWAGTFEVSETTNQENNCNHFWFGSGFKGKTKKTFWCDLGSEICPRVSEQLKTYFFRLSSYFLKRKLATKEKHISIYTRCHVLEFISVFSFLQLFLYFLFYLLCFHNCTDFLNNTYFVKPFCNPKWFVLVTLVEQPATM